MRRSAFAWIVLASTVVSAEEVVVSFEAAEVSCRGTIVATSAAAVHEVPFSSDVASLLDVERPARLSFRSDGCWIAAVDLPSGTKRVAPRAWPVATLRGSFTVPPAEKQPDALTIRVTAAGLDATFDCLVTSGGWRCPVPSTRIDARLSAPSTAYAPHYLRGLHPRAGEQIDAGTIELRAGASIIGLVDPADGVIVELRPEKFEVTGAGRERDDAIRARPARDGFFQFTGITPGTYEIRASAPGRSPARVGSFAVGEPREYPLVSALRLEPLVPIRVRITPPADALQRPWTVLLERTASRSPAVTTVAENAADPTGWWETEGVESGTYHLTVRDAAGARLHSDRLEVTPATGIVEVRLAVIPIRGRVRTGMRPFRATLEFHQTGGRGVDLESDDEGTFAGLLPGAGHWSVRVKSPDRRFYVLRDVKIEVPQDKTVAEVDLSLPGGRVRGTVVDEKGDPLEADVVIYRNGRPEADAVSDAEGKFELVGIEPGPVALRAVTRGGESALVPSDASENGGTHARLVIGKQKKIEGWLSGPDGHPIAGALLRYVSPSFVGIREASSGPSGEFELRAPAGTMAITIAVLVPGAPIRLQTIDTAARGKVQITGAAASGRLLVRISRRIATPLVVAAGGAPFPLSGLIFPPDGSGRPPRGLQRDGAALDIEPGLYRLCSQDLRTCLAATLQAGGEAIIDADALQPEPK